MQDNELIGYIGNDSGQMMLTDPAYVLLPDTHPQPPGMAYEDACAETLSTHRSGILTTDRANGNGLAAVVETGYGDGTFPVYVTRTPEGRIASLTVRFI